jgi:hypothetical protein
MPRPNLDDEEKTIVPRRRLDDVVVLLPGITGSVLRKDGRDVWGYSGGAVMDALLSRGQSIKDLALRDDPLDADDLGDGITASRVMPDLHLIPGLWKIDGYSKVAAKLQSDFEAVPGQNYFEFPYDWRCDNRRAARKLARQSREWLQTWRERSGNAEAKLILLAHSMGGLVSRYFLECLDGWRDTRMLVSFGTPYRGSLNALNFLVRGFHKKLGPFTLLDLTETMRTFTSIYQLLPVYPCVEVDGRLVRLTETGDIPELDQERLQQAARFHEEIREAVATHQRDTEYIEHCYEIHPLVGTFQPTLQSARLAGNTLELLRTYQGEDQDGDGTVPRVSATPLELGNRPPATYASERHASLQNFDPLLVQLNNTLSGLRIDLSAYYAVNTAVALDLDDVQAAGEPVMIRARPETEGVELTATVYAADRNEVLVRSLLVPANDGWDELQLDPLPPGIYRVRITGDLGVDPVTDLFAVFAAAG